MARSGKQEREAYSVNIAANPDTITQLLTNKVLDPANTLLLPAAIYTLPQTINVPGGQNAANFFLSIDKAQLKTYAGKKVAIAVGINTPSAHTISPEISKLIVVIDVTALKL